jgi:hypothetical protein
VCVGVGRGEGGIMVRFSAVVVKKKPKNPSVGDVRFA